MIYFSWPMCFYLLLKFMDSRKFFLRSKYNFKHIKFYYHTFFFSHTIHKFQGYARNNKRRFQTIYHYVYK